jgi:PAS domain-containing protein
MNATTISLLQLLLNLMLGGGLLASLLRHRVQMRGEDRSDFEVIVLALKEQREEDHTRILELEKRSENQEAEISGLRIARDLDPFPHWLMDIEGRYSFVNQPFEERFLDPQRKTRRDIIGKKHEDFWPEAFCLTLKALDASARKRPDGTARAHTTLDVPGFGKCEVTVHKFPCRIKGVIVSYAGYITTIDPLEERLGYQPQKQATA